MLRIFKIIYYIVLISTYWNVNWVVASYAEQVGFCFNLNLLECKFKAIDRQIKNFEGFNLNLLECKYRFHGGDNWHLPVF